MPELPEVETTVRGLRSVLPGKKITGVWNDWPKIFRGQPFNNFKRRIIGKKITGVKRKGKNVLIALSGNLTIIVHMKMTGHFLYGRYKRAGKGWIPDELGDLNDPYNRFIHLVISLSDKRHLAFSDMRKFAKITLADTDKLNELDNLKIGPDPLDKNFNFQEFKETLMRKKNSPVKQTLMNQEIISGIGNIYSDECLWFSGIHPKRKISGISDKELKLLLRSIKKILIDSIKIGGDSASDYRDPWGRKGDYQNRHKAYRMTDKPCLRKGCSGKIERIKIGGRSAHFCSLHQK